MHLLEERSNRSDVSLVGLAGATATAWSLPLAGGHQLPEAQERYSLDLLECGFTLSGGSFFRRLSNASRISPFVRPSRP
jgi:hypothetical protein